MDSAYTTFILAYHGCDRTTAERIFAGMDTLVSSHNDYDWLADGIYFWEHNAKRAFDFACQLRDRPHNDRQQILEPAVVGAVVDLGNCLNLLDGRFIELVKVAHGELIKFHRDSGTVAPGNTLGRDLLLRHLDCAVLRTVHETRHAVGEKPFDTVRALFSEGAPLYENAGFAAKNHIQICVRNPACIKGYFRPLDDDGRPLSFA